MSGFKREFLHQFLEEKCIIYNNRSFIANDPICVPHLFSKKEDIEISAFLTATISWGKRSSIIINAQKLMNHMDSAPYDFVMHHTKRDLLSLNKFVHRTFNANDCKQFITSLKHIYKNCGGLELAFADKNKNAKTNIKENIVQFRDLFLEPPHLLRIEKHLSNPHKNSSAKRMCMFLRWMVRKDKKGVDFGIWNLINPRQLCLPLDVHTGNVSRTLGLLQRKQNDWKAVEEVTSALRKFDPNDPIKYDFALFGLGVEKIM